MPTKQEVDNAIKALKKKCICGDNYGSMQEHLSVIEQLSFSYFEEKNETKKMLNRKEYYKHEYFSECDRAEKLNKALDSACDYLALMEVFRKPLSKQDWLKILKEMHNGY